MNLEQLEKGKEKKAEIKIVEDHLESITRLRAEMKKWSEHKNVMPFFGHGNDTYLNGAISIDEMEEFLDLMESRLTKRLKKLEQEFLEI